MTLYEYTTPTYDGPAWDQDSPLYRHYGTISTGITIYKNDSGWHVAEEGYDPIVLEGASVVYLGGRVYLLTEDDYEEVIEAGFGDFVGMYPGECPGPGVYPTDGSGEPSTPGEGGYYLNGVLYPSDDLYPADDLYPGDG